MSTELFDEKGELPAVTRFYGGKDRGVCLQLTKTEGTCHGYITFPISSIEAIIKRLRTAKLEVVK